MTYLLSQVNEYRDQIKIVTNASAATELHQKIFRSIFAIEESLEASFKIIPQLTNKHIASSAMANKITKITKVSNLMTLSAYLELSTYEKILSNPRKLNASEIIDKLRHAKAAFIKLKLNSNFFHSLENCILTKGKITPQNTRKLQSLFSTASRYVPDNNSRKFLDKKFITKFISEFGDNTAKKSIKTSASLAKHSTKNAILEVGEQTLKKSGKFISKKTTYILPFVGWYMTGSDVYAAADSFAYHTDLRDPQIVEEYKEVLETKNQYIRHYQSEIDTLSAQYSSSNQRGTKLDQIYMSAIEPQISNAKWQQQHEIDRLNELLPAYIEQANQQIKDEQFKLEQKLHWVNYPENKVFLEHNADKHPELLSQGVSVGYADNTPENWRIHYDQKPDILYK